MKRDIGAMVDKLNIDVSSDKLVDVVVVSLYEHGRPSIDYSPGVEDRAAAVIGYLTALCTDLVPFVRR